MRGRADPIRRLTSLVLAVALVCGIGVESAQAAATSKTIRYHGYDVTVPRSWPVYELARNPQTCVRFNRHAVYLGIPGAAEVCPANPIGRTEAILIEPLGAAAARSGAARATASPGGLSTHFAVPSAGVEVTATWLFDRSAIVRALHRTVLPSGMAARPARRALARPAAVVGHAAGTVYTGPGFDACHAPSPTAMSAWLSSPYRAIGIYIGGANAACPPGSANPNLTATWVAGESAAGWGMIPTYVGLQAPSNSCSCKGMTPGQASAQGTAAAQDAVVQAQSLGIPAGDPIYDDMEYYSRTQSNSSTVLAFLASWTTQLHAEGYLSGVYGNANSAIADLVTQYGTTYPEPDDIWFAAWPGDGSQSTSDPNIPAADWANHQRLHQYRGGHNESYGGVTINIDSNYLDAATATGGSAPAAPPPTLSVVPSATGMTNLTAGWAGSGLSSWRVLAGTDPASLVAIGSASAQGTNSQFPVRSSAPYFAVQAVGSTGQLLATSPTVTTPSHLLLFGHSVFVGATSGIGGLPVGCYLPTTCHLTTTVTLGRQRLATTGTEAVASGGSGLVFFKLAPTALRLLNRASRHREPVKIMIKDVSGLSATTSLMLIPFSTRGPAPVHSLRPDPVIRPVGMTDFVYARGAGGILTGCNALYACRVSATLSVGATTIATTRPELVGGQELGYVLFSIAPQGRQMLVRAAGNQLAVNLTLKSGSDVARARITLVQFS
jgi:hypothetical protein